MDVIAPGKRGLTFSKQELELYVSVIQIQNNESKWVIVQFRENNGLASVSNVSKWVFVQFQL